MTIFCDFASGSDGNTGTSRAQAVKTLDHASTLGDNNIRVVMSGLPCSTGITSTFTVQSQNLTLSSSVSLNIDLCNTSWTPGTSNSTTTSADRKLGSVSTQISFGGSYPSGGVAAYDSFSSTNFSSYQQISFWIKTNGNIAANLFALALCSDASGTVPVNTVNIPAIQGNQWTVVTVDTGAALGAAIQSIALIEPNAGLSGLTIKLDNIIACLPTTNPDAITLSSLIGTHAVNDGWYAIRSMNGTAVIIDQDPNSSASSTGRGYSNYTNTSTVWRLETTKTTLSGNSSIQSVTAGFAGTISGGWDSTNMTSQIGYTVYDGQNGLGNGLNVQSSSDVITIAGVGFYRYNVGISSNSNNLSTAATCLIGHNANDGIQANGSLCDYEGCLLTCNQGNGIEFTASDNTVGTSRLYGNAVHGIVSSSNQSTLVNSSTSFNNGTDGFHMLGNDFHANNIGSILNGNYGLDIQTVNPAVINGINTDNNASYAIAIANGTGHRILNWNNYNSSSRGLILNTNYGNYYLYSWSGITGSLAIAGLTTNKDISVYSQNEGGDYGVHNLYSGLYETNSSITNRHTSSGICWTGAIQSNNSNKYHPVQIKIPPVAFQSGTQVTISAYVYRNNTNNVCQIRIPGGYVSGINSDITAQAVSSGAYEQVTLLFTPGASGVLPVYFEFWGPNTGNCYIDDMSYSQV